VFLDLLGPAFPLPALSSPTGDTEVRSSLKTGKDGRWESTVAGLQKRRLLREVLGVTGQFRELQAMNLQYDNALRELEEQDVMIID
jgi:hypothetical protein